MELRIKRRKKRRTDAKDYRHQLGKGVSWIGASNYRFRHAKQIILQGFWILVVKRLASRYPLSAALAELSYTVKSMLKITSRTSPAQ